MTASGKTTAFLLILSLLLATACSGSKAPAAKLSHSPTCNPSSFYKPNAKFSSALLGYRCREEYAAAVTATFSGRLTFENSGIYRANGSMWRRVVRSEDSLMIPFNTIQAAQLDPMLIASRLSIALDVVGEPSLDLESLDCNGQPSKNGFCVFDRR